MTRDSIKKIDIIPYLLTALIFVTGLLGSFGAFYFNEYKEINKQHHLELLRSMEKIEFSVRGLSDDNISNKKDIESQNKRIELLEAKN